MHLYRRLRRCGMLGVEILGPLSRGRSWRNKSDVAVRWRHVSPYQLRVERARLSGLPAEVFWSA